MQRDDVTIKRVRDVTDYQSNIIISWWPACPPTPSPVFNPAMSKMIFSSVFFCLSGSFSGLLHLQKLDLSNNSLHFIQYGVLEDLYFLSELKLGGNPWVCAYR